MAFRLDVFHHFKKGASEKKLNQILTLLTEIGEKMSALSDAVDAVLAAEADEDAQAAAALAAKDEVIAELQAQNAAMQQQLADALANDAADAATIADTQAQLDAQAADVQAQIDRLNQAFPTPPPVEPPPVDPGNPSVPPEGEGPQVNPL